MEEDKTSMQLAQQIKELERKQAELQNDTSKMENKIFALSLERDTLKTLVNCVVSRQKEDLEEEENMFDRMIHKRVKEGKEETKRLREIKDDIKVLEIMLARGTVGLMDMQMMEEEIKESQKSDGALGNAMEVKIRELVEGMWELKREIVEVMNRKNKELMNLVQNEGENITKQRRISGYGVVLSVGVGITVAVYKFFAAKSKTKIQERK